MTTIPDSVWQALIQAAREAYPRECCGILLGRGEPPARAVERIHPVANSASGDARSGFLIPNAEVAAAAADAQAWGGEVVGFYHSHPDRAVYFSTEDEAHAWPGYCNLVLGVRLGEFSGAACYIVDRATGALKPEPLG